ncbi:TMEM165/GDT1 family protein [Candidatus Bathyarchaeota archaeon]|nr:TMEM165/GDT1 family protein [Candidatus Bathyarchaeota archaeon]
MDFTPLIASLFLILLSELGDKTQICTIMLAARSPTRSVFLGAMSAFFIIDGVSALVGGELPAFLPRNVISLISGVIFMIFGVIQLVGGERRRGIIYGDAKASFIRVFLLVTLMELGDKTQIMSVVLAAQFGNPLMVFLGIMLAFSIITGVSVILGGKILRAIPERYLTIGSSLVFLAIGLILILEALNISALP